MKGGGHGVNLEEGPHGPQEPLMPQEQRCHLTLHFTHTALLLTALHTSTYTRHIIDRSLGL